MSGRGPKGGSGMCRQDIAKATLIVSLTILMAVAIVVVWQEISRPIAM